MNEIRKEYSRLITVDEEKEFSIYEKIRFRDRLLDIIKNHHSVLTSEELRNAKELLNRIQCEIDLY